ncbi:uncharacterized protein METZ01_LOCUS201734, partial [marine metagenome]
MVANSALGRSRFDFRRVHDLVVKLAESTGVPHEDATVFA